MKAFPEERTPRAGTILLIVAVCYFVSGPLVTDPASMFEEKWRYMRALSLIAAVIMLAIVPLMKIGQLGEGPLHDYAGLVQRCSLLTFYTWVFTFLLD